MALRSRACGLALLMLWLGAGTARAADQGLRLITVLPEGGGKGRALVEVTDAELARDFSANVHPDRFRVRVATGGGAATSARHLATGTERAATVLAFDQSGSFATYWQEAFSLVRDVFPAAMDRQAARQARVMTFGLRADASAAVQGGAALRSILDATASQRPNQQATRLKAFILDAAKVAAADQPLAKGGLREVVVFTDAGEESDAYDVAELARNARDLGVRIHIVCFYRSSPNPTRMAKRLDEMKRLAELTGGTYLQVEDRNSARAALDRVAAAADNLYWLDLAFCGLHPGAPAFEDHLSLEVITRGVRAAWSDPLAFTQRSEGVALQSCGPDGRPLPVQPPAPTPPAPHPVPLPDSPNTHATPAPTSLPIPIPVEESHFPWWWLVLAVLGLAILILVLRRRAPEAPPPVKAAPPPVVEAPPAPVPAPAPAPPAPAPAPAWRDPFATLPETRLTVVRGPPGLETTYRINKPEFTVGGAAGPGIDLAVGIAQVSGRHATFQLFQGGNLFLIDHHSTNGTFVDGRQLSGGERVQLKPGQSVQLSRQLELRVEQPGLQPAASPASLASTQASAVEPGAESGGRTKARTIYAPVRDQDKE